MIMVPLLTLILEPLGNLSSLFFPSSSSVDSWLASFMVEIVFIYDINITCGLVLLDIGQP